MGVSRAGEARSQHLAFWTKLRALVPVLVLKPRQWSADSLRDRNSQNST
jgi:hypothetical protein